MSLLAFGAENSDRGRGHRDQQRARPVAAILPLDNIGVM
jgi:hypothetical protein